MHFRYLLAASCGTISAAVVLPTPALAQQITAGIEGTVETEAGAPIAGATVIVTDQRTNQQRTFTTGEEGGFQAVNLPVGGPYLIEATAAGYQGQTLENVNLQLGGSASFTFSLAQGAAESVIVVTGARAQATQLAVGPGIAFGQETLEGFPSITRDVRDIIRIDPRVSIDQSNDVDRISCLGGNDRSNTFTVDGIVQADVFGLNGTPFAARNSLPIPFDAIEATSVEFAPFDVEYSEFTGCLVNTVTKSGSNRFSGSAFFAYRDAGLRGDEVDGEPNPADDFQEKRWGATLGGPIIPNRLFFFGGYEETDLGSINDFGPAGAGFANEANFVTQAQFDRFAEIANRVYGQDVGGYPTTLPESAVRYFGRLDAIINEDHRIEGTYQRLEETNVELDFGGQELGGLNSFEDEGTISNYYSVRLYSTWSDIFSSEIRLSRAEVTDQQGPFGFNEAQSDNPTVRLEVAVPGPTQAGALVTGPGIFRSANELDTNIDQARVQLNFTPERHNIKLGGEINDLAVFNLFAINATGTLYFSSLENFEQGILSDGSAFFPDADDLIAGEAYGADINATPSGDINEASAEFTRRIYSLYAQDEYRATDQLTLIAGLRAQFYEGDAPLENPAFIDRYGFSNAFEFSDIDMIFLPRAAFNYEFENEGFVSDTRLIGGVGRFTGGDPVVYFSNGFSNNGFSTGLGTLVSDECDATNAAEGPVDVVQGGQFTGLPQCVVQAGSNEAAAGLADTQSTDPDYTIPSVWRFNLGLATRFGTGGGGFLDNWNLQLDYIFSHYVDTINFVDLAQTPDIRRADGGTAVDGRPIYRAIDPTAAGCGAVLQGSGGTPPVYTNVTAPCFATGRDDEIQLTNGPSYDSHVASLILSRRFDRGIFTAGGAINVNFGYAFTDSNNNRDNESATATSSYDGTAAFDRQNPAVSTSNFESRHNITFAANFRERFFGDYATQLGLIFIAKSGRPYSLTFDGQGVFNDSASGSDNALLYVPSGVDDPNIAPPIFNAAGMRTGGSDLASVEQLIAYADASGCDFTPGASIARNTCSNDWYFDLDLRLSQQLPGPARFFGLVEDRFELFADFDNFLNFIDNSWNVERERPDLVDVVDGGVDNQGRYVITGFAPDDQNDLQSNRSVWRIQIGARYEF